MGIQVGDRFPEATLRRVTREGVRPVSTAEILAGRRVVVFGVPGAFTPVCSDEHLPGFQLRAEELRRHGVEAIICVAVNDHYVMDAWGKARGVGEEIVLLADGNGELARALGLELDLSAAGLGRRLRRFAALVEDGVVRVLHVEPAKGVNVSSAEEMLRALAGA
jgi:peroxiredoxin